MTDASVDLSSWPGSVDEEDAMLNVTNAAGDYLNNMLESARAPAESAVRLEVTKEGLIAAIDEERPGDARVDHEGRKVLVLDQHAAQVLSEKTLDVQAAEGRPRLGIR
jgi:hypothetical protein